MAPETGPSKKAHTLRFPRTVIDGELELSKSAVDYGCSAGRVAVQVSSLGKKGKTQSSTKEASLTNLTLRQIRSSGKAR